MTSTSHRLLLAALCVFVSAAVPACRLFDDSDAPCEEPGHCDVDEGCIDGACQCTNADVDLDECVDGNDRTAIALKAAGGGRVAEATEREDVNCDGTIDDEDLRLLDLVFCQNNCFPCPALDIDGSGCTSDRDVDAWRLAENRDLDVNCDGAIDEADDGNALAQAISNEQCPVACAGEGEGE